MGRMRARLMTTLGNVARYVLTVVWLAAGITKLFGYSSFQGVLYNHEVLSDRAVKYAWIVPVLEVLLGAWLFVFGRGWSHPRLRRAGPAASGVLLVAFVIYVSRVPADVFKLVGCGCAGLFGLTDLVGYPSRGVVIGFDLVLAGLSLCLWPSLDRSPNQRITNHAVQ